MAAMQSTHTETWRPVSGWEGLYEVSDHGRVRSVDRVIKTKTGPQRHKGRILKTHPAIRGGYPLAQLWHNGKAKIFYVHTLVLEAFTAPYTDGMEACHNDGDPLNNHVSNLRWGTKSENMRDAVKHGTHANAAKTHCKWGHEYTPENTYRPPSGGRECWTCKRNNRTRARLASRGA